jgi:hypothetical protein
VYTLIDSFNDAEISRHRTLAAAARAQAKHLAAVRRANGADASLSISQRRMLARLRETPGGMAWPCDEPILGAAKLRTLRSLKRLGLVKRRCWTERTPSALTDEDWEEWTIAP